MSEFLKSTGRRLGPGWLLPMVLLALPGCFLNAGAYDAPPEIFKPGEQPLSGLIMCDIPKVAKDECATQEDVDNSVGTASTEAAVALNNGDIAEVVLDWSDDALKACNNLPRKVTFHGTWPNGSEVCLNGGTQIGNGKEYKDANEACVAKCQDLVAQGDIEPSGSVLEFCQARAHVSVNFNPKTFFPNFCSDAGVPLHNQADPRLPAENLKWTDLQGTELGDNGLTLKYAGPGNGTAASDQLLIGGDAWVEFEVGETGVPHVIGVRTDGSSGDMPIAVSLEGNGDVNVLENGAPNASGPFPAYFVGQKFRIHIADNHDSPATATITFASLPQPCIDGVFCTENGFYPPPLASAPTVAYPLRVNASFSQGPATLKNVKLMRIITQ
jgi:hypothetical protein